MWPTKEAPGWLRTVGITRCEHEKLLTSRQPYCSLSTVLIDKTEIASVWLPP